MIENMILGFREAFSWQGMGLMFLGSVWGFIGGALPGVQASTAMALILPLTWTMPPGGALMMLAAVYVSAEYSGSVPAILIRTPGTSAALVTTFDGYPLHQQGKGGKALSISLFGGGIGQIIGNILLVAMVLPLSRVALAFGPPEFFALAIFGLTLVASLGEKSVSKALISGALGVAFATIGLDPLSGTVRFTFGVNYLVDGFETVAVLVGLLAVSEIFIQARDARPVGKFSGVISTTLVTWAEFKPMLFLISWTSVLGMFIGVLPGAGATIASLVAYSEAKRWSKHPEMFGKGSYEGVAAPETANNSAISGAMVPMLAFGVPGSGSAAIMIAALMLHGVTPGPMLFVKNPEIVYGLFFALFIATFMMLIMGMVSIKPLIKLVSVPKPALLSCILALVFVGMYTNNNSLFDVGTALGFGILGYLMNRYDFSAAACVLGFVLGPMVEVSFRQALIISNKSPMIFVQRPIALVLLVLAFLTFIVPIIRFSKGFLVARKNPSAQV
jgi:putative tricarboxylic transport membrane protein